MPVRVSVLSISSAVKRGIKALCKLLYYIYSIIMMMITYTMLCNACTIALCKVVF